MHQDISNLAKHMQRREKLYRLLGVPMILLNGRKVLEVGPGGGYNALALLKWGVQLDLVEPNPKAQEELVALFGEYGIEKQMWRLYPEKIEQFVPEDRQQQYPVILAEGFLPGLSERKEIIRKLSSLLLPGGVIVVNCIDDMSCFFELVRRIVGFRLIQLAGVDEFEEQVRLLSRAFKSHLQSLGNASRPVEDWVMDQLLNPWMYGTLFSLADAVREFGPQFQFLGSSPDMFVNFSWYKDLAYDTNAEMIRQFEVKRHLLLSMNVEGEVRPAEENENLVELISSLRRCAEQFEQGQTSLLLAEIIMILQQILRVIAQVDERCAEALLEAIDMLKDDKLSAQKVSDAQYFSTAFGRGLQYISLVKDWAK